MNMLKTDKLAPVLGQQAEWFLRAIAVHAWQWRKPLVPGVTETQRIADEEETRILINALTYGVLGPAFVDPVEIDFMKIFDDFFDDPRLDEKGSMHLVQILALALEEALGV